MIPQTATLGGTVRAMKRETLTLVEEGMRRVVSGVASPSAQRPKWISA